MYVHAATYRSLVHDLYVVLKFIQVEKLWKGGKEFQIHYDCDLHYIAIL